MVLSELEKHQQALKRLSEELEKLKHAEGNLSEVKMLSLFSPPRKLKLKHTKFLHMSKEFQPVP